MARSIIEAPRNEERSDEAGDGFAILRIVAALMVILAHSFPVAAGLPDPAWQRRDVIISFGSAAVCIFFVISGYLVSSSWIRDPNPIRFTVRRVARIWPGLLVMLLITTWVVGSAVTTLPLTRYLTDPGTWRYLLGSALLLPVWDLPGVFRTGFAPGVNGSVWTLPIEVTAYAGLLVFGPLLVTSGRRRLWVASALAVGIVVATLLARAALPQAMLDGLQFLLHQHFLLFFLVGALLYIGRRRVPMTWPLFAAAMLGLLVALVIGLEPPVIALLSYGVIFLSTRRGGTGWRRITRLGDPSYGIYIYAYPIQQLLVHLRVAPNWWILFLEASVASVVVGYLSWHLVEHRALVFARRALRRPAAETVARPDLSTAA
jgi:peptidoglycan/LPS O-acetylase OafA/YrhL